MTGAVYGPDSICRFEGLDSIRIRIYYTYMKTKLTLSIDPQITHRAKHLAKQRGMSLSSLVEKELSEVLEEGSASEMKMSFSQRWAGKLVLNDKQTERAKKLRSKYGLDEFV